MNYTEQQIIESLRTGDNDKALEYLYQDIFPKVRSYIIANSGREEDALDVFQDAIVALCKQIKMNRYDTKHSLSGFIYSVSRNLWINHAKRRKFMASFPDNADYSDHYDFSDEIYTDQYKATINKVINLLGKKCFDLLKLSVVYKTSSADICRKMGFATENSVKTQKYKCKMKFLKILNENALFKEVLD